MTVLIGNTTIKAWPRESVRMRVERSFAMLYLHGVITEGERTRLRKRLGPPPWEPPAAKE